MSPQKYNKIEKENDNGDKPEDGFGKVVDALHNKNKLPSLRTYQGDMAEFIKEKNESVISVSMKEKKRRENREEEERKTRVEKKVEKKEINGFGKNIILFVASVCLVVVGAYIIFKLFSFTQMEQVPIVMNTEIIPYNEIIEVREAEKISLAEVVRDFEGKNGINIIKITNNEGFYINNLNDYLNYFSVQIPSLMKIDLRQDFSFGFYRQNDVKTPFVVLKTTDFGRSFSAMLDWEGSMSRDLNFGQQIEEIVEWKDIIIKNKDTRAMINKNGEIKIVYTFLDQNTILITGSASSLEAINEAYISRAFIR